MIGAVIPHCDQFQQLLPVRTPPELALSHDPSCIRTLVLQRFEQFFSCIDPPEAAVLLQVIRRGTVDECRDIVRRYHSILMNDLPLLLEQDEPPPKEGFAEPAADNVGGGAIPDQYEQMAVKGKTVDEVHVYRDIENVIRAFDHH